MRSSGRRMDQRRWALVTSTRPRRWMLRQDVSCLQRRPAARGIFPARLRLDFTHHRRAARATSESDRGRVCSHLGSARVARRQPQPCTCGLVNITSICDAGCVTWYQQQRMDPLADEAGPDSDEPRVEGPHRHDQVEAQLARALGRRVARPGSEPGEQSVSVAVAAPEWDEAARHVRLTWCWSGWHPVHVGLAVTVAVGCFGLIALMHFEPVPAPESSGRESFAIERVLEHEGGATIISHGERDGDTTWLHLFELNWSDRARPAPVLVEDMDKAAEDSGVDSADDIPVAKPIAKMAEDRPVVPARSIRRRVIPVKKRSSGGSALIEFGTGRTQSVRAVPLRDLHE